MNLLSEQRLVIQQQLPTLETLWECESPVGFTTLRSLRRKRERGLLVVHFRLLEGAGAGMNGTLGVPPASKFSGLDDVTILAGQPLSVALIEDRNTHRLLELEEQVRSD
ncbi:MAG: hypothetical protein IPN62_12925 [Flavobacteriales bacterium]|nr:hypothetical protein [Flavobacteriales bacterium]